jgi:hypothetical protein
MLQQQQQILLPSTSIVALPTLWNTISWKQQSIITSTITRRYKSSYTFDGVGGGGGADMWEWPVTRMNTIFNIVPQGHKYVVERFGRLNEVHESGWFLAIPFVDRIAYVIDVRERALDIAPQAAITRDNGMFPVFVLLA